MNLIPVSHDPMTGCRTPLEFRLASEIESLRSELKKMQDRTKTSWKSGYARGYQEALCEPEVRKTKV